MFKNIFLAILLFAISQNIVHAADYSGIGSWYLGETIVINKKNEGMLPTAILQTNERGGTILINPDVKKGPMPVRPNYKTRIVDLRYNGGINIVRGNHPRLEGIWPQYSNLNTGLGRNFVVSDVLPFDAKVETWKGEPKQANGSNQKNRLDSNEYSNSHNHYQNLLSEVWAFSPNVNAVALWGDSGAFYPGAKSWGGFLSARSWPVHWKEYVPEGTPLFKDDEFDAQLVGLEVDVLNGGRPEGTPPKNGKALSKTGIQIVGFGNRNTAAIELRSEDSDDIKKTADQRRGTWQYGIIAHNSLHSGSTLLFSATPNGKTGIDLSQTNYSDSAIKIKSEGENTGISFNNSRGGEIFSQDGQLKVRLGDGGLSLINDGGREVVSIGKHGQLSLKGVVLGSLWSNGKLLLITIIWLAVTVWLVVIYHRQKRAFSDLTARFEALEHRCDIPEKRIES
jgi:hypothetical protein